MKTSLLIQKKKNLKEGKPCRCMWLCEALPLVLLIRILDLCQVKLYKVWPNTYRKIPTYTIPNIYSTKFHLVMNLKIIRLALWMLIHSFYKFGQSRDTLTSDKTSIQTKKDRREYVPISVFLQNIWRTMTNNNLFII